MITKEQVAKRLKEVREEKGVTAEALSLAIGKRKDFIARIEEKNRSIRLDVFADICRALSIMPQEFLNVFKKENK